MFLKWPESRWLSLSHLLTTLNWKQLLMRISFYIIPYQIRKWYKNIRNLLKSPQGGVRWGTQLWFPLASLPKGKNIKIYQGRGGLSHKLSTNLEYWSHFWFQRGIFPSQSTELPLGMPKLLWKLFSTWVVPHRWNGDWANLAINTAAQGFSLNAFPRKSLTFGP